MSKKYFSLDYLTKNIENSDLYSFRVKILEGTSNIWLKNLVNIGLFNDPSLAFKKRNTVMIKYSLNHDEIAVVAKDNPCF